jgi:hypothetical protein
VTTLRRTNYGRGHGYKLDGRKVEGVTTLIGKGIPKPALPYWSARTVAEYVADADEATLEALRTLGRDGMIKALKDIPWGQRDSAAVRGTQVHALADQLAAGMAVHVPDALAGHVDACLSFLNDTRVAPVVSEAPCASREHRYAGTFDMIGDFPDGRRAIFDYKTSASGVWPETALQLAAYRWSDFYVDSDGAERSMAALGITCAYAVWLRSDGYDLIPVETGPDVFDMFRAVTYVARRIEDMRQWIGEAEDWRPAVAA